MQYLQPSLFEPLGMEGMDWLSSPEGINTGGYGLRVKTEDIAKFGQLYLQKGQWNGQQIIPSAWVEEATRAQVQSRPFVDGRPKADDDWAQGYGYQFWRCTTGGYRGDGAYGQYCLVLPDKDTVIAITSESFDMQASMNLVWNHLLPAIEEDTLPADENAQGELKKDLENLSWEPPRMNPHSPLVTQISGKTFTLGENDFQAKKIAFNFSENACIFTLTDEKGEHQVTCGMHQWIEENNEKTDPQALFPARGRTDLPSHMAASATWQEDNILVMSWRFVETAHSDQLTCIFDGDKVTLQFLNSVAAGSSSNPDSRPELYGIMV